MNRRNFLGSILGTLVIAKIPFIADPMYDSQLDSFNNESLIYMSDEEIYKNIKGTIYAGFDDIYPIKAANIINIERKIINNIANINFRYDDILAIQSFKTNGCVLTYNKTLITNPVNFSHGSQTLMNGDVLKVNHNIELKNLNKKQQQIFQDLINENSK